jgi:serine/threonine protein kinase
MAPIQPRYIPKDTESQSSAASSIRVLRVSDNESFIASPIPDIMTKDPKKNTITTPLASVLIPTAAVSISRILNHPNIISLVDVTQSISTSGQSMAGEYGDLTIWEDMDAGCLSYLLPSPNALPDFTDSELWHGLAAQNFQRFSLPESLCWHVLSSISSALLWLHHGVKETEGITGEFMKHDDDVQPILIRDISPGQIWFKHPRADETYGECKLGGFQWAKVTGVVGGRIAITNPVENAPREKQFYWAPVCISFCI